MSQAVCRNALEKNLRARQSPGSTHDFVPSYFHFRGAILHDCMQIIFLEDARGSISCSSSENGQRRGLKYSRQMFARGIENHLPRRLRVFGVAAVADARGNGTNALSWWPSRSRRRRGARRAFASRQFQTRRIPGPPRALCAEGPKWRFVLRGSWNIPPQLRHASLPPELLRLRFGHRGRRKTFLPPKFLVRDVLFHRIPDGACSAFMLIFTPYGKCPPQYFRAESAELTTHGKPTRSAAVSNSSACVICLACENA